MKRLSVLVAVSALSLASCSSTAPPDGAMPTAAASSADMASIAAGKQVYDGICSACHNGGDETAPPLATLHTFDKTRVSTALSETGLMALQSKMLTPEQRTHVIAFVTASPAALTKLA